jgi:hypothetical protein
MFGKRIANISTFLIEGVLVILVCAVAAVTLLVVALVTEIRKNPRKWPDAVGLGS